MINLNLNKKEKYILACSYGPDSMCLFDLLIKGKFNFCVAHVNYHLRQEESEEVEDLKRICKDNKIKLYIKDFYMPLGVNEEGWAREVRYKYFVELANELKINNVLIAHNEDDLIETFLIQKKRRGIVSYYGLNKEIQIENVKFLRPLLNYKKEDLLKYCNNYNVHYGFDFSNFDTKYLRNNLRRNIVVKLTNTERHNLLNEIKILNEKNLLNIELLRNVFSQKYLETCKLIELSKENLQLCVINYLNYKNIYLEISKGFINELYSLIRTKKSWHKITQNGIILSIDYGYFGVYKIKEDSLNKITINKNSSKFEILKNSRNP